MVPRIDPRCNGGVTCSERLHCAKVLSRVAVGHLKMICHASLHHLKIPAVALNRRVKFSQCRQDLGHPVPVGLTDAHGRGYCLRKLLMGSLQLQILSSQVLHLCHQRLDARFVVHHTPGTATGVL